jgi:hypothetical protein
MTVGDIASMIIALGTIGSLLYISRQVNVARKQAKGQFLLALDAQFEKFNDITMRLVMEPNFVPQGQEWAQIFGLMSVFERINIMVEDGIMDVAIVDRLHGFRLLKLIANDSIFQRLSETGAEWQDFIDMCYSLAQHREEHKISPDDKPFIQRVRTLRKDTRNFSNPFAYDPAATNTNAS